MAQWGDPQKIKVTDVSITTDNTIKTVYPQHTFGTGSASWGNINTVNTPMDPWAMLPEVPGLDELCELLGVEPSAQGPLLTATDGQRYSLVDIIQAQLDIMIRLQMLLVHRNIGSEEE